MVETDARLVPDIPGVHVGAQLGDRTVQMSAAVADRHCRSSWNRLGHLLLDTTPASLVNPPLSRSATV